MNPKDDHPVQAVRWQGEVAIVEVRGDIDLGRSIPFQQALLAVADRRPKRIVINLSAVGYMDSSGVASLVKLLSRTRRRDIGMALVNLTDRVRSILEITRLDKVFEIHPTEQEAMG